MERYFGLLQVNNCYCVYMLYYVTRKALCPRPAVILAPRTERLRHRGYIELVVLVSLEKNNYFPNDFPAKLPRCRRMVFLRRNAARFLTAPGFYRRIVYWIKCYYVIKYIYQTGLQDIKIYIQTISLPNCNGLNGWHPCGEWVMLFSGVGSVAPGFLHVCIDILFIE